LGRVAMLPRAAESMERKSPLGGIKKSFKWKINWFSAFTKFRIIQTIKKKLNR